VFFFAPLRLERAKRAGVENVLMVLLKKLPALCGLFRCRPGNWIVSFNIMNSDLEKIVAGESVRLIAGLAAGFGVDAYLAGGGPRDSLLRRPVNDLDFALGGAWVELPRRFAERWGGRFFWLDEERLQARVVKKSAGDILVCDFAPLRGATIEDDLRLRDFTINALAVPVAGGPAGLIDPSGGLSDLREKMVRACTDTSFDDDPLRLLRALRFAAELGFSVEERTWSALCLKGALLAGVAAERVRDELFRILSAPGVGSSLERLNASGLLRALFRPELSPSAIGHAIGCAAAVERACGGPAQPVEGGGSRLKGYVEAEVESGITMRSLLKLAAFVGYTGEAGASLLAARFRLGRKATRLLAMFCREEGSAFGLPAEGGAERALFRFFRDRHPAGPGLVILALAAGAISPSLASRLFDYYWRNYDPAADDLFLTGAEVMSLLGIGEGEAVGAALAALREAESRGLVNDREEARAFVKNLLTREPSIS
jgi:poly(A) polymerase